MTKERRAYMKQWRSHNKKQTNATRRAWRQKQRTINSDWREEPKRVVDERRTKWRKDNKEHVCKYAAAYMARRRKENPQLKIQGALRSRCRAALKRGSTSKSTLELLGCNLKELQHHLESQFQTGMNWRNYGVHGWHIDHIIPCDCFDLTDPLQQTQCFHYSNLQPLWAHDNITKSNTIPPPSWTVRPDDIRRY